MKPDRFPTEHFTGALLAGLPAPFVFFVAASAFEKSPTGEIIGGLGFGLVYLAFAQFWVVPRRLASLNDAWPTVLGTLGPLAFCVLVVAVLENPHALWQIGLPCLVGGATAGWAGAWLAQRLTAPVDAPPRRSAGRCALHVAGIVLLIAVALTLLLGVVPATLAGDAPGFSTAANIVFFRITAGFELVSAAVLVVVAWRAATPAPRTVLGLIAFASLLLGLMHTGMSALCAHYPTLLHAAWLLAACAAANFSVICLVSLDSVLDDRRQPAAVVSPAGPPLTAGSVSPGL